MQVPPTAQKNDRLIRMFAPVCRSLTYYTTRSKADSRLGSAMGADSKEQR